jgi:hypothetical protein
VKFVETRPNLQIVQGGHGYDDSVPRIINLIFFYTRWKCYDQFVLCYDASPNVYSTGSRSRSQAYLIIDRPFCSTQRARVILVTDLDYLPWFQHFTRPQEPAKDQSQAREKGVGQADKLTWATANSGPSKGGVLCSLTFCAQSVCLRPYVSAPAPRVGSHSWVGTCLG